MKSAKPNLVRFGLVVSAFLLLVSCGNSRKTYVLTGRIISKLPSKQLLIVNNDDIPGFMPAMTMPYEVKDPDGFAQVQADGRDSRRSRGGEAKSILPGTFDGDRKKRRRILAGRPRPAHVLMIGEKAPDVPLVNQDGKTLHFSQFKGKPVLLTFIYTRCPFPDYCPLLSRQFAAIQKSLAKNPEDLQKTHLISISLDPNYDKPPILREYGLPYMEHDPKGFQHWDFVSTTPDDLQKLVGSFGLEYSEEDSQISHSMNTILLAPDGTSREHVARQRMEAGRSCRRHAPHIDADQSTDHHR